MFEFEHKGWRVSLENRILRVYCLDEKVDVDACNEGLWVLGSAESGNPFLPAVGIGVTLPWPVLEAILEARRLLQAELS